MNKLSLSKKEKINKIFKIKKIINSLLLSKKEKLVKIKELINKPKKDVYKPIKILVFLVTILLNTKVIAKKININIKININC